MMKAQALICTEAQRFSLEEVVLPDPFFLGDDGWQPCRRAAVKNMALGALPWAKTITHRIEAKEAPAMFERINQGAKDVIGVVIRWM